MTLSKFLNDLTQNAKQAPQILEAEITDVQIMKIQHDGTETVERISITTSDKNKTYVLVSAFNN